MSGWETIGEAPAGKGGGWQPGDPMPPDAPEGSSIKTTAEGIPYMAPPEGKTAAPAKPKGPDKDGWEDVAPDKPPTDLIGRAKYALAARDKVLDNFWGKIAEGGLEGLAKESLPSELADRVKDVREANAKFQKNREWDRERARRTAAGESLNGMENWKLRRLNEIVQETKPQEKPMSMAETWNSIKKSAVDDPGGFMGQLARGFIVHPELLTTPELLPMRAAQFTARVAKTAEASARTTRLAAGAAKVGTEAAQIGAAAGGESVLSQLNKKGTTSASQTAMDTIMATTPVVAGRMLTQAGKTSVAMAIDYAVARNLKDGKIETSPELVKAAMADVEARVASGYSIDDALREALEAIKVDPDVAKEVSSVLKPVEPANPIVAAVVRFGGKDYEGTTHIEAIKKAVADGVPLRPDGKTPVLNQEAGDTINLFKTNEGKVITRDEAGELVGAKRTEEMPAMGEKAAETPKPEEPPVKTKGKKGKAKPAEAPKPAEAGAPGEPPPEAPAAPAAKAAKPFVPKTPKVKDKSALPPVKDRMAYRGYSLIRGIDGEWHASDGGHHITSGTLEQVKKGLDAIKGDPGTPVRTVEKANETVQRAGVDPKDTALSGEPTAQEVHQAVKAEKGADAADAAVRDAVLDNKIGGLERGSVDPVILRALGLVSLGAVGAAIYTKDPKDAIWGALATGGVLAAGKVLRGGVRSIGQVAQHLKDTRYRMTEFTDAWSGSIKGAELANFRFAEMVKTLVTAKADREDITRALQGTPTNKPLSPEAQQVVAAVRDFFETYGEKGQQAGILPEDLLDNYVTNLWTGLNKNDSLWRNLTQSLGKRNNNSPGMSPRSRFSMERVIPNYAEGIKQGLIPATMDIADIVRIYGDNISRAIANKNLVAALERAKHPDVFIGADGTPFQRALIIRDTPDAQVKTTVQAAAIVDRQWQGGGALAKDIRDQAIKKAPKEYVVINHPQMRGYKVHEDIALVMENLFNAPSTNAAVKLAYGLSIAAKRGIFSYSLFHVKSLTDAMLGTSMRGWVNVLNGNAYRTLKHGRAGDVLDELVRGGLNVVERPMEGDVTPFTNTLKLIEEKFPVIGAPVKGARMIGKALDTFLWSVVHPTFKVATAMASFEKVLKDSSRPGGFIRGADKVLGKRASNLSRAEAAKIAASATNDIFGGLDWFRIADGVQNKLGRDLALAVTSAKGRQFMQIMMLAPDWTVATTRAMVKAIPGVSRREISALHQGYVVRSAIMYAVMADGLNQYYFGAPLLGERGPDHGDLGDGRKLQLSKHFMEPIHWLMNPSQQALNKLGYVPKEIAEQWLNKQFLSPKGSPPITTTAPPTEPGAKPKTAGSRLGHALAGLTRSPGSRRSPRGRFRGSPGSSASRSTAKPRNKPKRRPARRPGQPAGTEEAAAHRTRLRIERAKRKRELEKENQ